MCFSARLTGYVWEKDFLCGGSATRTLWPIHIIKGLTIWAFDSSHFIEVFVYYLHPLFLQLFFASQFRRIKHKQDCNYRQGNRRESKNQKESLHSKRCHFFFTIQETRFNESRTQQVFRNYFSFSGNLTFMNWKSRAFKLDL